MRLGRDMQRLGLHVGDEEESEGVDGRTEWRELSVKSSYCVYFDHFDFFLINFGEGEVSQVREE